MNEIKKAYHKIYKNFSSPDTGKLPKLSEEAMEVTDEKLLIDFFWRHVAIARAEGKTIPTKMRRKLKSEEWADLKRKLEIIAHQTRYALSYINEIDK